MVNPSKEQPAGTAQAQPPAIQGIQPPTRLNLSGKDKAVNWKIYKQQWENYSIVAQLDRQSEDYRVALFLYSIDQEAVKTYNSFDMSKENPPETSQNKQRIRQLRCWRKEWNLWALHFQQLWTEGRRTYWLICGRTENSGTIVQFLHMPLRLADERLHCPWHPRWENT